MAKPNVVKETETKTTVVTTPELTHLSLGIHRLSNGSYAVAKVMFNPLTKEAAVVDVIDKSEKGSAIEQFKIFASNEIFSKDLK